MVLLTAVELGTAWLLESSQEVSLKIRMGKMQSKQRSSICSHSVPQAHLLVTVLMSCNGDVLLHLLWAFGTGKQSLGPCQEQKNDGSGSAHSLSPYISRGCWQCLERR